MGKYYRPRNESLDLWEYVIWEMSNTALLNDLGFESADSVEVVYVVLMGGDLVHPFLGESYITREEVKTKQEIAIKKINDQFSMVEKITHDAVEKLKSGHIEEACEITNTSEKVVYICTSLLETHAAIKCMIDRGFGTGFCDYDIRSTEDGLIFIFYEEYSYYYHEIEAAAYEEE